MMLSALQAFHRGRLFESETVCVCMCPKALFLQIAGVPPLDLFYKLGHSAVCATLCKELLFNMQKNSMK